MSDVARIKAQIYLEEAATRRGFNDFAAVARHTSIIAQMERMTEQLRELYAQGKHDEARTLLENDNAWI